MKYAELPIKYLESAEEILLFRDLPEVPDWTHNPYMPIIKNGKIEVARAKHVRKLPHYWNSFDTIHIVESDAWWIDNEHTCIAIRCRWHCAVGDVWWKKRNSTIWFYEYEDGEWHKRHNRAIREGRVEKQQSVRRKLNGIKTKIDAIKAFEDLEEW